MDPYLIQDIFSQNKTKEYTSENLIKAKEELTSDSLSLVWNHVRPLETKQKKYEGVMCGFPK